MGSHLGFNHLDDLLCLVQAENESVPWPKRQLQSGHNLALLGRLVKCDGVPLVGEGLVLDVASSATQSPLHHRGTWVESKTYDGMAYQNLWANVLAADAAVVVKVGADQH